MSKTINNKNEKSKECIDFDCRNGLKNEKCKHSCENCINYDNGYCLENHYI